MPLLNAHAAGEAAVQEVLLRVAAVRNGSALADSLLPLLNESAEIFQERSEFEVGRLRGFVMQVMGDTELPLAGIPSVLEALETGHNAYTLAAAAKALRGLHNPDPAYIGVLDAGEANLAGRDDFISFKPRFLFDTPDSGNCASDEMAQSRSFLTNIAKRETTPLLGEALSCCGVRKFSVVEHPRSSIGVEDTQGVVLEDQDGRQTSFEERFVGRPSIVTFFYTRCENPRKCSLTIERLSQLQRRLAEAGLQEVNLYAVTYDPTFDGPSQLKQFGEARKFEFGPEHAFLRATSNAELLRRYFDLGVGYVDSAVNSHRKELFLLDSFARVHRAFLRVQWDESEVLQALRTLSNGDS